MRYSCPVLRDSYSSTSRKSCHLVPSTFRTVHVYVLYMYMYSDGPSSHSAQNGTRAPPRKGTLSDPNNGLPSRLAGPVPIVLVTIPRVSTLWEACLEPAGRFVSYQTEGPSRGSTNAWERTCATQHRAG